MTERKVWAIIAPESDFLADVLFEQPPPGRYRDYRIVEATLTIPDEPEWYVRFDPYGSGRIVIDPATTLNQYAGDIIVRAPDAQTALARAIEQRGTP